MIGYVTVGVDDVDLAERFYSATLPRLGDRLVTSTEGLSHPRSRPRGASCDPRFPCEASLGGSTDRVWQRHLGAFQVPAQVMVRALHRDGLAAGGRAAGAPGFRAE